MHSSVAAALLACVLLAGVIPAHALGGSTGMLRGRVKTDTDTVTGAAINRPIAEPAPTAASNKVVSTTTTLPKGLPAGFRNTRDWYLKNRDKTATAFAPIADGKAASRSGLAGLSTEPILLTVNMRLLQEPSNPDAFHLRSVGGLVRNLPTSALLRGGDKGATTTISFVETKAVGVAILGKLKPEKIAVRISSETLDARFGFEGEKGHTESGGGGGVFTSMAVPGVLTFQSATVVRDDINKDGSRTTTFVLKGATLAVTPTRGQAAQGVLSLRLNFDPVELVTEATPVPLLNFPNFKIPEWWPFLRIKKRICVQPVRVAQRRCWYKFWGMCFWPYTKSISGRGLAFGQPGVVEQWSKVDLAFNWRKWKTVYDHTGEYESLTGAEEADLRAEVSDDDCIEVFFVEGFSPQDNHGGGACWGSGTANAKIITSDENEDCGIDLTHLAHELGHVVNIHHPGAGHATMSDGTPGTLMCGSGWERDNPRRNSKENGDNVANPLITNYVTLLASGTPDCNDSGDCGTCAAHVVDGPCV